MPTLMSTEVETESTYPDFKALMDAMWSHHRACGERALAVSNTEGGRLGLHVDIPPRYPLPHFPPVWTAYSADGGSEAHEAVKEINKALQKEIQSIQEDGKTQAQDLAREVQQNKNVDAFKQRMEALKRQTKEQVDKAIDNSFDAAASVGEKFPDSQGFILAATQKVVSFITNVVTSIVNFVTNLINNIANWISDAYEKVKGFFVNSIDSVEHFFASI